MKSWAFGALFFFGLGVLLYYSIFLSTISFGERTSLDVRFPDAKWLAAGDKVLVAGTRIGRVGRVEYLEDEVDDGYPVRAILELDRDLKLFEDARVRIESSTLLGGRLISIEPGRAGSSRLVSQIESIRGEIQTDLVDSLVEVVDENRDTLKRTLDNIAQASDDLASLLRSIEEGKGTAGRLLSDDELHREAVGVLKDVREILADIRSEESSFGRFLSSREIYDDIAATTAALREIAEGAAKGEGSLGLFLRDEALRERLDRIAARIDNATAAVETEEGLIGALLFDSEIKSSIQEFVSNMRTVSAEIASGRSLAGEILVGRRLVKTVVEPLEEILADARALTQNVREGRGIAGMLLSDNESAALLRSVLRNFGRTLEDAREAAPIGTLIGVLIGIF